LKMKMKRKGVAIFLISSSIQTRADKPFLQVGRI